MPLLLKILTMKITCLVAPKPTKALLQISIIIYKVLSTALINTIKLPVNIRRTCILLRPLDKSTYVLQSDTAKQNLWHQKRKAFSSSRKLFIPPDLRP